MAVGRPGTRRPGRPAHRRPAGSARPCRAGRRAAARRAARSRPRSAGSSSAWCSRWAMPKATWRDSSCRARWVTRRAIGSGACVSRNPSRLRKLPFAEHGQQKRGQRKVRLLEQRGQRRAPAGARHAERAAAQRRAPSEHLHVPRFVGRLHGEHLQHLAEVRVDATQEAGRDDQRHLLVFDQVGHHLHDRRLDLGGSSNGASQSMAVAGSHWLAAAWAYRRGARSAQTRCSFFQVEVQRRAALLRPARRARPGPRWRRAARRPRRAPDRPRVRRRASGRSAPPRTAHERPSAVGIRSRARARAPTRAGGRPAPGRARAPSAARRPAAR